MSHSRLQPIIELPQHSASSTTLAELLEIARERLGPETVLEFDSEIVVSMTCADCGEETAIFKRMGRLYESEFECPACGGRRDMLLTHRIDGTEDFLSRTLTNFDVPALGIVRANNGKERVYLELTGDTETFLVFN